MCGIYTMPKTTQSKLDYIKRWKEAKREEAKQNGTYKPRGRPKVTIQRIKTSEEIEARREYHREAVRKNNDILKAKRHAAKQERDKQKEELAAILNRIKSAPPEELAKVKELIYNE